MSFLLGVTLGLIVGIPLGYVGIPWLLSRFKML